MQDIVLNLIEHTAYRLNLNLRILMPKKAHENKYILLRRISFESFSLWNGNHGKGN